MSQKNKSRFEIKFPFFIFIADPIKNSKFMLVVIYLYKNR